MEQRFGRDFSGVRIHTDGIASKSALDLHANAYTLGQHIFFADGKFSPTTQKGRRLIAHELAHVAQRPNGASPAPGDMEGMRHVAEQEAEHAAGSVLAGRRPGVLGSRPPVALFDRDAAAGPVAAADKSPEAPPPGSLKITKKNDDYEFSIRYRDFKKWANPLREAIANYVIRAYAGANLDVGHAIADTVTGFKWTYEAADPNEKQNDDDIDTISVDRAAQRAIDVAMQKLHPELKFSPPALGTHPIGDGSSAKEKGAGGGTGPVIRRFTPAGELLMEPAQQPFITESEIIGTFHFTGDHEGLLYNAYPFSRRVRFDWTVTSGNKVVEKSLPGRLFPGNISHTFSVDDPGAYNLSVEASSEYFNGGVKVSLAKPFTAASEEAARKGSFDERFTGTGAAAVFEYDADGSLKLKKGATAKTIDDQLRELYFALGAVQSIQKRGGREGEEAKDYVDYFEKQIKALEELRAKTLGSRTYIARGIFADREAGTRRDVNFTLTGGREKSDSGQPDRGNVVKYEVAAYDFTFTPNEAIKHDGAGYGSKSPSAQDGYASAEKAALDDMADDWHSYNDYPYGSIEIGVQLLESSGTKRLVIDTYNWKRTARKVGTAVVVVGSVALLVGSGGTLAPVTVVVLEGVTLATGVALTVDGAAQRIRNGTFHADAHLVMDMLSLVPLAGPLVRLAGVAVGRGMILLNLAVGAANMVLIAEETRNAIMQQSAIYAARIEQTADPVEKERLQHELDGIIAQILGGAAASGGLMLVMTAAGAKQALEAPRGAPAATNKTAGGGEPVAGKSAAPPPAPKPAAPSTDLPPAAPKAAAPSAELPPAAPKATAPSADLPAPAPKPAAPSADLPPAAPKAAAPSADLPPASKPAVGDDASLGTAEATKVSVGDEAGGMPKDGVPIRERAKVKGVKIPDYAAQDPDGYYYDPKSRKYLKRLGNVSRQGGSAAARQEDAAMRAKALKRLEELHAQHASTEAELQGLRNQRDQATNEYNKAVTDMAEAVAEERTAQTAEGKAAARQKARAAKIRRQAAQDLKDELPDDSHLRRDLKRLAVEIDVESIKADPESRGKLPCFSADTMVATPSGPSRIDELRAGNLVWGFDFIATAPHVCRVTQTHLRMARDFVKLVAAGVTLRATRRHRFWVEDGIGWLPAAELRAGMRVRSLDGCPLELEAVTAHSGDPEPTYNLSVDSAATFFVGAGILVHNEPVDVGLGGSYVIYRAVNRTNPEFAGLVYIGQTNEVDAAGKPRGVEARGGEHQASAQKAIGKHEAGTLKLSAEDERFYRFMKEAELEPVVRGISTKAQADYLEQLNIEIERKVSGRSNVLNRREQIERESHMKAVVEKVMSDPEVKAKYCP